MQLTRTLGLLAASLFVLLAPFLECAAGDHLVRKTWGTGTSYSPEIGVCDFEWKVRSCRANSWTHGAEEAAFGSYSEWHESKKEKGHEGHWSDAGRR
ncbi:hypothetical protein BDW67DRAFT_177906 [Aspergillus spinulosporus]